MRLENYALKFIPPKWNPGHATGQKHEFWPILEYLGLLYPSPSSITMKFGIRQWTCGVSFAALIWHESPKIQNLVKFALPCLSGTTWCTDHHQCEIWREREHDTFTVVFINRRQISQRDWICDVLFHAKFQIYRRLCGAKNHKFWQNFNVGARTHSLPSLIMTKFGMQE